MNGHFVKLVPISALFFRLLMTNCRISSRTEDNRTSKTQRKGASATNDALLWQRTPAIAWIYAVLAIVKWNSTINNALSRNIASNMDSIIQWREMKLPFDLAIAEKP